MARKSGIYCILNLENNKKYIGSSINIYDRWATHKRCLNNNTHINKHLQSAWVKYGYNSFKFFIIEEINANKNPELIDREDYYILKFNTINPDYGYNTDMARNKVAHSGKSNRMYRPIVVLNKIDGSYFNEYESIADAARALGTTPDKIDMVLNKRPQRNKNNKINPSYRGYIFIYKAEYDVSKDYSIKYKTRGCAVAMFDKDFNYIRSFKNCTEASNELNIKLYCIIDSKTFGYITNGYYFKSIDKKTENYVPYIKRRNNSTGIRKEKSIIVNDGINEIEFKNTRTAMEHFGLENMNIRYIRLRIRKGLNIKNMIWKYR